MVFSKRKLSKGNATNQEEKKKKDDEEKEDEESDSDTSESSSEVLTPPSFGDPYEEDAWESGTDDYLQEGACGGNPREVPDPSADYTPGSTDALMSLSELVIADSAVRSSSTVMRQGNPSASSLEFPVDTTLFPDEPAFAESATAAATGPRPRPAATKAAASASYLPAKAAETRMAVVEQQMMEWNKNLKKRNALRKRVFFTPDPSAINSEWPMPLPDPPREIDVEPFSTGAGKACEESDRRTIDKMAWETDYGYADDSSRGFVGKKTPVSGNTFYLSDWYTGKLPAPSSTPDFVSHVSPIARGQAASDRYSPAGPGSATGSSSGNDLNPRRPDRSRQFVEEPFASGLSRDVIDGNLKDQLASLNLRDAHQIKRIDRRVETEDDAEKYSFTTSLNLPTNTTCYPPATYSGADDPRGAVAAAGRFVCDGQQQEGQRWRLSNATAAWRVAPPRQVASARRWEAEMSWQAKSAAHLVDRPAAGLDRPFSGDNLRSPLASHIANDERLRNSIGDLRLEKGCNVDVGTSDDAFYLPTTSRFSSATSSGYADLQTAGAAASLVAGAAGRPQERQRRWGAQLTVPLPQRPQLYPNPPMYNPNAKSRFDHNTLAREKYGDRRLRTVDNEDSSYALYHLPTTPLSLPATSSGADDLAAVGAAAPERQQERQRRSGAQSTFRFHIPTRTPSVPKPPSPNPDADIQFYMDDL